MVSDLDLGYSQLPTRDKIVFSRWIALSVIQWEMLITNLKDIKSYQNPVVCLACIASFEFISFKPHHRH